jgi:hypothetical protein
MRDLVRNAMSSGLLGSDGGEGDEGRQAGRAQELGRFDHPVTAGCLNLDVNA